MRTGGPFVLSIGGLDPSAGAGILSDIKTYSFCDVMGLAVSTCITVQNHSELNQIYWLDLDQILAQIQPLRDYPVKAVKISVIRNWNKLFDIVREVKRMFPKTPVVLDPVLMASSGFDICPIPEIDLRDRVLNEIEVITPNHEEYLALDLSSMKIFSCDVYHKSAFEEWGVDLLIRTNGDQQKFYPEKQGCEKHGSGCVFSASLAAYLAKGEELLVACAMAKKTIESYLTSTQNLIGTLR
ncbi:MAG: bifunctional hydroxymethylpyrimidine kinase/phosphomethylpyrimidine kinase [Bacteroidota bacterium]